MPFTGIHDHTLDAKNRLTVPARARPDLGHAVSVVKGFDGCLELWPSADYDAIARQALQGVNPLSREARDLRRHLHGNSFQTELDKAGRVMLPANFLTHASISKDVVLVGTGSNLEVWDRDAYAAQDADLIARASDHIERLGHPA